MKRRRTAQGGFAAVAAVFLVLFLAALGAFMVSFSNTQQLNSVQDLQGSRAYWAARAGLEWAYANPVAACPTTSGGTAVRTLRTVDTLSVCVVCTRVDYSDPDPLNTIVSVNSNAYSVAPISCSVADLAALATASVGTLGYVERSASGKQEALTVAITDARVSEGNAGSTPLQFTISQSAISQLNTTVNYATTAVTAIAGAACAAGTDYITTSGTATIAAGSTNTTVTVNVCGDVTVEPDETFTVTLTNAQNAEAIPVFLGRAAAVGTIANDD